MRFEPAHAKSVLPLLPILGRFRLSDFFNKDNNINIHCIYEHF